MKVQEINCDREARVKIHNRLRMARNNAQNLDTQYRREDFAMVLSVQCPYT